MKQTMVALFSKSLSACPEEGKGGVNQDMPKNGQRNVANLDLEEFVGIFFIADRRFGNLLQQSTKVSISYQNEYPPLEILEPKTCIKAVLVKSTTMGPV